ncbi:MAG: hypothetical protein ABII00_19130 [Elusimicrobiota bacterium]
MTGRFERGDAGFSLAELVIASLLFSMVIAGLAAIYGTVFQQSGRILGNSRIKNQAAYALRAMQNQVTVATHLEDPPRGVPGSQLSGCRNAKPDGTRIVPSPEKHGSFGFCLRNTAIRLCQVPGNSPPCLFYYYWPNICPPPQVTPANCGNPVSGVSPEVLASEVEGGAGGGNVFERSQEITDVRIAFAVTKAKTRSHPKLSYAVDTTLHAHFGVSP